MLVKMLGFGTIVCYGELSGNVVCENCVEITQEEKAQLDRIFAGKPQAEPGYQYVLRQDLTWEMQSCPPDSEPEE